MTLETLLETKDLVALDALTGLAADPRCAGEDLRAAFATQAQLRSRAAADLLASVHGDRTDLLASEQRQYDRLMRETTSVLDLVDRVAQRTASAYRPPASQVLDAGAPAADVPAVLQRGQSVRDYLVRRGGVPHLSDRGPAPRFGAIVRALALNKRDGLTDLERRLLAEGAGSTGGYLVPEIVAAGFIDRVRDAAVCFRAGAVMAPMASNIVNLARLLQPTDVSPSSTTPQWKTENDAIAEVGIALDRVRLAAKTLPAICTLSVELSEDAADVDAVIEQELAASLASEVDRAALLGSGVDPEPRGIVNTAGVTIDSFGGATPTNFDHQVDLAAALWTRNHAPNAFVYNGSIGTMLAKLKDSTYQPLRRPEEIAIVPRFTTNAIPNDAVSPDTSQIVCGDFSRLVIGVRTNFTIEVSRVSGDAFGRLQVQIRTYWRGDVGLADPRAFAVLTDVGIG